MSAAKRGATLLEVLAASSLSLLALSVLVAVVVPAFRASGYSHARMEMQQEAAVALRRLGQELQRSTPRAASTFQGPDGTALSLHKVSGVTAGDPPLQIFANQLIFYVFRKSQGTLYRQPWSGPNSLPSGLRPPNGSVPLRPTEVDLESILQGPPIGRKLAAGVQEFSLASPAAAGYLASPVSLTLRLERRLPGRSQPTGFTLTQVVSLRNSE